MRSWPLIVLPLGLLLPGLLSAAGLATDALDTPGESTDRYLTPAEVRGVLHGATEDFYTCFRSTLRGGQDPGETAITFTIAADGEPVDVVPEIARAPEGLASCITGVVVGLEFDDHDGAPMEVSYPLVYQVDTKGARILPYPIVFTRPRPVRLPLLELPEDLEARELRLLEWILTEEEPPPETPEPALPADSDTE